MFFLLLALLLAETAVVPSMASEPTPIVVELFTSEGCSSCPPADALLGELAARPDVVALAFHVDYWDYIGWTDPYASPDSTQRQRDYASALGLRMIYTPQMVIDGRTDVVGSDRRGVESAIAAAARQPKLAVSIESDGGGHRVVIPAATDEWTGGEAAVWLAVFDQAQETKVHRGENSGRNLKEYNIVREWRQIGSWNGAAVTIPLEVAADADRNGCAIIVQSGQVGPVLGATIVPLTAGQL